MDFVLNILGAFDPFVWWHWVVALISSVATFFVGVGVIFFLKGLFCL